MHKTRFLHSLENVSVHPKFADMIPACYAVAMIFSVLTVKCCCLLAQVKHAHPQVCKIRWTFTEIIAGQKGKHRQCISVNGDNTVDMRTCVGGFSLVI